MEPYEGRPVPAAGIDLGADMGYSCVVGDALLSAAVYHLKEKRMGDRVKHMYLLLRDELLPGTEPETVCVEYPPFCKNLLTHAVLHQYLGVALSVCAQLGIDVFSTNVKTLKLWGTGSGGASKDMVRQAMTRLSGDKRVRKLPYDATDAMLCAYYASYRADPDYWRGVKSWRQVL
jgi:Holliday junction resolvasome RuvABC endonuclease subunit